MKILRSYLSQNSIISSKKPSLEPDLKYGFEMLSTLKEIRKIYEQGVNY